MRPRRSRYLGTDDPRQLCRGSTLQAFRMDQQKGRPVLLEFSDLTRPSSLRTNAYARRWHERYGRRARATCHHGVRTVAAVHRDRRRCCRTGFAAAGIERSCCSSSCASADLKTAAGPCWTYSIRPLRLRLSPGERVRRGRAGDPGGTRDRRAPHGPDPTRDRRPSPGTGRAHRRPGGYQWSGDYEGRRSVGRS